MAEKRLRTAVLDYTIMLTINMDSARLPSHMGAIWWGTRGTFPPTFSGGGYNMPCSPTFFSLGFVFEEVSKIKICQILCEEVFMLGGRLHIAKFMLNQCLVWYH